MADEPDSTTEPTSPADPPDDTPDWEAEARKWKALARKHEKGEKTGSSRVAELEAELAQLREANQTDADKALEAARRQGAEQATADLEQHAAEREKVAARRLLAAEARVQAMAAGVQPTADRKDGQPDRVDLFVRLLDLDAAELTGDDGLPDSAAVAKLVKATLKAAPEFATVTAGGFDGGPRATPAKGGIAAGAQRWRERHPQKSAS